MNLLTSKVRMMNINTKVGHHQVDGRTFITSDVHSDLFHDSRFTWIHQNSCRFDSIQLIYDELPKRLQVTIHKSGEQHRRFNSQFNSPMIAYTRFNSIPFNKNKTQRLIYDMFNLAKFNW